MDKYSIVIQAGGKSTRMGQDKASLPFENTSLLNHIVNLFLPFDQRIIIISNIPRGQFPSNVEVYPDVFEDIGALGGIYSGLFYSKANHTFMVACDMPFINIEIIKYMQNFTDGYDIVVPALGKKRYLEPFFAYYSKKCMPIVRQAIEKGEKKAISFYENCSVKLILENELRKFDSELHSFININTPEDLTIAKNMINQRRTSYN